MTKKEWNKCYKFCKHKYLNGNNFIDSGEKKGQLMPGKFKGNVFCSKWRGGIYGGRCTYNRCMEMKKWEKEAND